MKIPIILKNEADALEKYYQKHYPAVAPLVKNCFLNTIETTVKEAKEDYFVITGDIYAMWLRDSSEQLMHYVRYAAYDEELQTIIEGVIRRQVQMILIDPYANAFNESPNGKHYSDDGVKTDPYVWERKYEIDSLCEPIYLIYRYWKTTGKDSIFNANVKRVLETMLDVFTLEQRHENSDYLFLRKDCREIDTLPGNGKGNPVGYTGMTWSGFRPSDDRCLYGYLIPAQFQAVHTLGYAAEILRDCYHDPDTAGKCEKLAAEIAEGIEKFGIIEHQKYGKIYAYETDGLGNYLLMDDANTPSLLSLPYLGACAIGDEIYQNTRKFVLSGENPNYYEGSVLKGIGSEHSEPETIWPIAIIMQALTSEDKTEIKECIDMLVNSHAGTYFMHESIHKDNPADFTRSWFAWANSLFAELLIQVKEKGFFD
ncbi:glycoside hydrolase family 125 protein [Clostridiales bacterium COT073_COT-073]|nr:glycoside hydrolase family 125 protein [Clostridiales bacterium COT073_COT-073]